jgi:hypothetical protein
MTKTIISEKLAQNLASITGNINPAGFGYHIIKGEGRALNISSTMTFHQAALNLIDSYLLKAPLCPAGYWKANNSNPDKPKSYYKIKLYGFLETSDSKLILTVSYHTDPIKPKQRIVLKVKSEVAIFSERNLENRLAKILWKE